MDFERLRRARLMKASNDRQSHVPTLPDSCPRTLASTTTAFTPPAVTQPSVKKASEVAKTTSLPNKPMPLQAQAKPEDRFWIKEAERSAVDHVAFLKRENSSLARKIKTKQNSIQNKEEEIAGFNKDHRTSGFHKYKVSDLRDEQKRLRRDIKDEGQEIEDNKKELKKWEPLAKEQKDHIKEMEKQESAARQAAERTKKIHQNHEETSFYKGTMRNARVPKSSEMKAGAPAKSDVHHVATASKRKREDDQENLPEHVSKRAKIGLSHPSVTAEQLAALGRIPKASPSPTDPASQVRRKAVPKSQRKALEAMATNVPTQRSAPSRLTESTKIPTTSHSQAAKRKRVGENEAENEERPKKRATKASEPVPTEKAKNVEKPALGSKRPKQVLQKKVEAPDANVARAHAGGRDHTKAPTKRKAVSPPGDNDNGDSKRSAKPSSEAPARRAPLSTTATSKRSTRNSWTSVDEASTASTEVPRCTYQSTGLFADLDFAEHRAQCMLRHS